MFRYWTLGFVRITDLGWALPPDEVRLDGLGLPHADERSSLNPKP